MILERCRHLKSRNKSIKERHIYITKQYANQILEKLEMNNCKSVKALVEVGTKLRRDSLNESVIPRMHNSLVGIIYYQTLTRPDIR